MPSHVFLSPHDEEAAHRVRLDAVAAQNFRYPRERFAGRGIVIPAGGARYLPCAWVCVKMLRQVGCTLPIELWHLGPEEMDENMRTILAALDVTTVDARVVEKSKRVRTLNGWELKPFALLHCRFTEVMLLDADNVALTDPAFLFDTPKYRELGALFWPDFHRLAPNRSIWRVTGVPYRDEPEFESGQIVIDKARCWKALNVTMHLNEYSDFYNRHIYGDKDTFRFAWRKIGQEYAMIPHRIFPLKSTMCQHDFDGRRILQHRNFDKWRMDGGNRKIRGFLREKDCIGFLEELFDKHGWMPPGLGRWHPAGRSAEEIAAADELVAAHYEYRRIGYDRRPMSFARTGIVRDGAAGREIYWDMRVRDGLMLLEIFSNSDRTCALARDKEGVWRGIWDVCERMPIELALLSDGNIPRLNGQQDGEERPGYRPSRSREEISVAEGLVGVRFVYHRVGHDRRTMALAANGEIGEGAGGCEVFWDLSLHEGIPRLEVFSARERTFTASREQDGIWRGHWEVFECMPVELIPIADEVQTG